MMKNHRWITSSASICGESKRNLEMPGCAKKEDCHRSYYLYIPSSLCTNNPTETKHVSNETIPLVFGLHCLGCTARTMIFLETMAEELSFVLVVPEGVHRTWNARYCCGYALENEMDDVGFLQSITKDLSDEFTFVSKDVTYAMGYSNGGYLASHAADLFRGVAAISGHDYEPSVSEPTSLFMHHSLDDNYVRITGCCSDSTMPECCCEISQHADQCTSATEVFHRWAKEINKCTGETEISFEDEKRHITCHTGIGCAANTTFCVHRDSAHFNKGGFENAFPMTAEVGDFFGSDACSINGGAWSSLWRNCTCRKNGDGEMLHAGTYCLGGAIEAPASLSKDLAYRQEVKLANLGVGSVTIIVIVTGLALCLWRGILTKRKLRYIGWAQVPVSDSGSLEFTTRKKDSE